MPITRNKVAEIGPGLGDLTEKLLKERDVVAFEIDEELCDILKKRFTTLSLVCGDVLEQWRGSLLDESYDLIANLPYYIATNIILRALNDPHCQNVTVLIQKEVAEKFSAQSGEKNFGSLSLIAHSVAEVEIVCFVPPEAFTPAPKVDSAVISFRKQKPTYDTDYAEFLKTAFTQPRKTLMKNLSAVFDKTRLQEIFSSLQLEQVIRPHQLSHELFYDMFCQLKGDKNERESRD